MKERLFEIPAKVKYSGVNILDGQKQKNSSLKSEILEELFKCNFEDLFSVLRHILFWVVFLWIKWFKHLFCSARKFNRV